MKTKRQLEPIKATLEVEIPAEKFERFLNWVFGVRRKPTDFVDALAEFVSTQLEEAIYNSMDVVARKKNAVLVVTCDAKECDYTGDDDEEDAWPKVEKEAIKRWKAGEPLPDGFYSIDKEVCLRAYLEGIKLYGLDWEDSDQCDNSTYDHVFQIALFGEHLYG